VFACARHLTLFYVLVGLTSDNPGLVCSDPGAWTEAGFPVEDRAIRMRNENVADQCQIIRIPFLPGPS